MLTAGATDGSTTFVVSSWEGNTWLTVDDSGELETRRWLDGDTLFMARAHRERAHGVRGTADALHFPRADGDAPARGRSGSDVQARIPLGAACRRAVHAACVLLTRALCCLQVASDPIWNGQSDDLQVLMTRTVTADEEEFLLAPEDHPPPVIKEVVKVRCSMHTICIHTIP